MKNGLAKLIATGALIVAPVAYGQNNMPADSTQKDASFSGAFDSTSAVKDKLVKPEVKYDSAKAVAKDNVVLPTVILPTVAPNTNKPSIGSLFLDNGIDNRTSIAGYVGNQQGVEYLQNIKSFFSVGAGFNHYGGEKSSVVDTTKIPNGPNTVNPQTGDPEVPGRFGYIAHPVTLKTGTNVNNLYLKLRTGNLALLIGYANKAITTERVSDLDDEDPVTKDQGSVLYGVQLATPYVPLNKNKTVKLGADAAYVNANSDDNLLVNGKVYVANISGQDVIFTANYKRNMSENINTYAAGVILPITISLDKNTK